MTDKELFHLCDVLIKTHHEYSGYTSDKDQEYARDTYTLLMTVLKENRIKVNCESGFFGPNILSIEEDDSDNGSD